MMNEKFVIPEDEMVGIRKIRAAMGDELPPDLDTDLNLRRWWVGWKGSMDDILPRFRRAIENRKAAGFDIPDFMERFFDLPEVANWAKYFSNSRIGAYYNSKNNSYCFFQRMEGVDYRRIVKVMKMSDFLFLYLAFCEMMLRLAMKKEAETGRPSGVSVVNDMNGANYSEFLNPNAPINKVAKLCTHILQDQYCEILSKMVAFRAPSVFNAIWQFMKLFVNEHTLKKIDFTSNPEDLRKYFDSDVIPVALGGNLKDTVGSRYPNVKINPDTCCSIPHAIPQAEKYSPGTVWAGLSSPPPLTEEYIKPGASFVVTKSVEKVGTKFGWQFNVNGEIEFAVVYKDKSDPQNPKNTLVYPRFQLITTRLPEEGKITCNQPGDYVFEFTNNTSYMFSIKLEYAVAELSS